MVTRRRSQLDRDGIARAALAIVDEDGLDALTMRALASRLACDPMTLYRHVRNRDDLLGLVVDTAISGIEPPDPTLDDRAWIRESMLRFRSACLRHPHVMPLIGFSLIPIAGVRVMLEETLKRLDRLPLEGVLIADRLNAMIGATVGYVMLELSPPRGAIDDRHRSSVTYGVDPRVDGVAFGFRPADKIVLASGGYELLIDVLLEQLVGPSS
jgi:AcrR family transcriptional regulator